jgi:hypothetical protein
MRLVLPATVPTDVMGISHYLSSLSNELLRAFVGRIGLRDNCLSKYVEYTTNSVPNLEDVVQHNLGVTPFMYIYNLDKGGVLYDSSRSEWSASVVKLKCTVANASARLLVFG